MYTRRAYRMLMLRMGAFRQAPRDKVYPRAYRMLMLRMGALRQAPRDKVYLYAGKYIFERGEADGNVYPGKCGNHY